MNLSLVDPFVLAQDFPEVPIGKLRSGHAIVIRFSHRGEFLAAGRTEGIISIWDIETGSVARKLQGHIQQIQSLSWSSNDRYLLSSAYDKRVILWDLLDGSRLRTIRFEVAAFIAELHPTNHLQFVTALFEDQPVLVDVSGKLTRKTVFGSVPKRTAAELENVSEKQAQADAKQTTTVAIFSNSGNYILAATTRGWLNIISTATGEIKHTIKVCPGVIFSVRLAASGREVLISAQDRVIRTYKLPDFDDPKLDWDNLDLQVKHKFQDLVNRTMWNSVAFASNAEYLIASTNRNPNIYIWERAHGSLVKIIEGLEELGSVEWHPKKPLIAAVGPDQGRIYLWSIKTPQRWSALAPDFVEVEENVDYIEQEDEFDIQPFEILHQRRMDREDEEVDVLSIDPGKETGPGPIFRMPVVLPSWDGLNVANDSESEDEIIAIGAGQYRRKSPPKGSTFEDDGTSTDDARKPNGTKNRKRARAEPKD